jgi:hypothetical protein
MRQVTSVSIITRLRAARPRFDFWQGQRLFLSLPPPDLFRVPPSLKSSGHPGHYLGGQKPTTHLNIMPRLRMRGTIPPFSHKLTLSWSGAKLTFSYIVISYVFVRTTIRR